MEAQLPVNLRKLLFRCEGHELDDAVDKMSRDDFLARVAEELNMQADEAEPIVRAVLAAVSDRIGEGGIEDVLAQLPKEFRDLFQRPI